MGITDALSIFNLASTSDIELNSLKKSYRALMQKNHPDHGGDETKAKRIAEAYDMLKKMGKILEAHDKTVKKVKTCVLNLEELIEIYSGKSVAIGDFDRTKQFDTTPYKVKLSDLSSYKVTLEIKVTYILNGVYTEDITLAMKNAKDEYDVSLAIPYDTTDKLTLQIVDRTITVELKGVHMRIPVRLAGNICVTVSI